MSFENNLSGVLSDKKIKEELSKGNIHIYPFHENQLSNSSYDITLGEFYYRSNVEHGSLFLPWKKEHVQNYWGEPKKANEIITEEDAEKYQLPLGTKYFLIHPGELLLAHTQEFIGGVNGITTMMKARSSVGRIGISVCKDAGWGDCSFYNRWACEVSNFSRSTIPLVVGSRIGQIVFFTTGEVENNYSVKGIYQKPGLTLEQLIDSWEPSEMLPKFRM